MPRGQAPPTQTAIASATPPTPPITKVTATPARETRAGHKCLRGSCFNQPLMVPNFENSPPYLGDTYVNATGALAYIKAFIVDGEALPAMERGYQCSMVIEERFLATKAKAEELSSDNEDLLKKISDVMSKVSEFEKLQAEAKENTKAITERKEALEKELQEEAYYQSQYDCIATVKLEVQQNLQVHFSKGWTTVLDKMQMEASSSLRQESNIPIPQALVIILIPKIQAIINEESPVHEVGRAGPVALSGGEVTNSVAVSTSEEPPRA
nr:hypothetical protein CFP56_47447 [Quercus suber]